MERNYNLDQLAPTFQMILDDRMEGVPVLNDRLKVKMIDFQQWKDYQLGILITPWFMNLILLPDLNTDGKPPKVGIKQTKVFPSGAYEFIVGFEDDLGFYLSCSLFSPMFEFEDQAAAELTAQEALLAIMDEDNVDAESQSRDTEIEQIWAGEKPIPEKADSLFTEQDKVENVDRKSLSDRIKEPTSRRDFLRGKVFTESSNK